MMINKFLLAILLVLMMVSCSKKQGPSPISPYEESTVEQEATTNNSNVVSVPYTEKGGNKYISVKVNGIPFQMTFDSGASFMSISYNEVITLAKNGVLTEDDFVGRTQTMTASGDIVENDVVNLREVAIGDMVFNNVKAVVVRNLWAPLLLGNNVLDNVTSYSVDNENKTINFELN